MPTSSPPALSFIVGDSELARRIRGHRWEDTELGALEDWPESLKTLVSVMLASNQQMYIVWGPSQILLYNDRYIEVLQAHHPALGQPFLQVWSEIVDDLTPLVEIAYAGVPSYNDDIKLFLQRGGRTVETHFAYSYTPIFNASGGVDGFFCQCNETTEKKRVEAALRETEQVQRLTLELVHALSWWADSSGSRVMIGDQWRKYTGQTDAEVQNFGWLDAIHPDDREATHSAFTHAFASGEPLERQQRIRDPDGNFRWHLVRHAPVRDANGVITPVRHSGAAGR